ncbi:MAG: hypothetical protein E7107_12770 [Prevotella sp.]|jgi:hypothetical protein|nr:hypothetical protein [Prevotella sp.]
MNKLTDNDIRDALKQRETHRTKLEVPADFCAEIMQEIAPKAVRRARYVYIAALAAAACIAFAVLMVWPKEDEKKSDGSELAVRQERTYSTSGAYSQSDTVGLSSSTEEDIENMDTESRVLPVKAAVRQAKRTDIKLVVQHTASPVREGSTQRTASTADSLDYYINKIERELAQVDDSLYIERIHRVMHADERLQRIVNSYILNELQRDGKSSEAYIINNVKTDEYEE